MICPKCVFRLPSRTVAAAAALLLGGTAVCFAQQDSGWRRVDDPPPAPAAQAAAPAQLVLPSGTFVTVRVNELLSSDKNHSGDTYTATLAQPIVVDGIVVARRGQTVAGRVTEVEKAGRVKGTSRLGVELTEISLVDGQQIPVKTELMEYAGGTSVGSDATTVGTAAGVGAAIGAVADGGFGAGMGAISGAGASAIGVLLTRGRATEIDPEAALTFRIVDPVTISTERASYAFQPVRQEDYAPSQQLQRRPAQQRSRRGPLLYPGYGWPYPPYLYGPRFGYYSGRRFGRYRGFGIGFGW